MIIPQREAPYTLANIWPSVKPHWHRLIDALLMNPWTNHVNDVGHQMVLVCDASTSGWGALLFDEGMGSVQECHGFWPGTRPCSEINELEMRALRFSLESFCDHIGNKPLSILMDNSASVHDLKKGSAHAFRLNNESLQVLRRLPRSSAVKVAYISGSQNPADALSRGIPSSSQLASVLGDLGRRLARNALRVSVPDSDPLPLCASCY